MAFLPSSGAERILLSSSVSTASCAFSNSPSISASIDGSSASSPSSIKVPTSSTANCADCQTVIQSFLSAISCITFCACMAISQKPGCSLNCSRSAISVCLRSMSKEPPQSFRSFFQFFDFLLLWFKHDCTSMINDSMSLLVKEAHRLIRFLSWM